MLITIELDELLKIMEKVCYYLWKIYLLMEGQLLLIRGLMLPINNLVSLAKVLILLIEALILLIKISSTTNK
jgi:hypothetical protein